MGSGGLARLAPRGVPGPGSGNPIPPSTPGIAGVVPGGGVAAIGLPFSGAPWFSMKGTGSVGFASTITSKYRWLPVLAPVEPSTPRTCPVATAAPDAILGSMLARCPYRVRTPPCLLYTSDAADD